MTKESAEKIISKHYHKDWKETYIYMIFNMMKSGQRFQLPKMDIIKNGSSYDIEIVNERII